MGLRILCFLLLTVLELCVVDGEYSHAPPVRIFNVQKYGAVADGRRDNSQAFLRAWKDACESTGGRSRVVIPQGTYVVDSVTFEGPCKGRIAFVNKGVLKASTNPAKFYADTWIGFLYVDGLVVRGGGSMDAQGAMAWPYRDCSKNSQCNKPLPVTLRLDFITNSRVHHLRSVDSKGVHIKIFASKNLNISNVRIRAPDESPNTDGIHIGSSSHIRISNSIIGTGDDCIAMVSGTQHVDISNVHCGPGHGISVGSLGKFQGNENVIGIKVTNCTFNNTQNGVRIKTWAPSLASLASNFLFQDIKMNNVNNPVIVDQQYCPSLPCNNQASSAVQIKNVTFRNIWGTSSSKNAVILHCSKLYPCKNVKLENINLVYIGTRGGLATASCHNLFGISYGMRSPSGCIN